LPLETADFQPAECAKKYLIGRRDAYPPYRQDACAPKKILRGLADLA